MIVLTHNYPSSENNTAGIFVRDHADKISVESETIPQIVHLAYGEKMSFAIGKIPKLFKYIFLSIGAIKRLNKSEQDEVIVHWWIPLGWLAAWFFKGKVSVVCHGTDLLTCDKNRIIAFMLRPLARRVSHWQCVSEHLAEILSGIYPFILKSDILIEAMPISSLFHDKKIERLKNHFLSVGPLVTEKGHKDAVIWLSRNYPGSELVVVGKSETEYLAELLELGKEQGIRIEHKEPLSREELAELFNNRQALLTFSHHEGFGLVCREAQACGCHVIGYIGDGRTEECVDEIIPRNSDSAG